MPRNRATQSSAGRAHKSSGARDLREPARAEHGHPVAQGKRLADVVRDVDNRQSEPLEQGAQVGLETNPQRAVEGAERLVQEEDVRSRRDRAGEGNPLSLSAGERRDVTTLGAGEPDQLECLAHARVSHVGRDVRDAGAEPHVPGHVPMREQRRVLEDESDAAAMRRLAGDVASAQPHASMRRALEPRDRAKDCRLARAARPDERQPLT